MFLQSGIKYRSFSEQSAFSFSLDASPSSWSGNSIFGISGSGGAIDLFKFENGKLFDPLNRFVHSYSSNDEIRISGDYMSGRFGYWINESPAAINLNITSTSKAFSDVYISTSKAGLDFDLNIYGYRLPTYDFSFVGSPFSTGEKINGLMLNTSSEGSSSFRVFSGSASFNYTGYKLSGLTSGFNLSPGTSAPILFDYLGNGSDYAVSASTGIAPLYYNLTLYTNFGKIIKTGSLDLGFDSIYFIDFYSIDSGFNPSSSSYFWNYNLEGKVCEKSPFSFKLEKISGFNYKNTKTGNLEFTGLITGLASGSIYGTGFLNGILSGNLKTNQVDYYGSGISSIPLSILHSGDLIYKSGYIDATGNKIKDNISGGIFGTGYVTETYISKYISIQPDQKTHKYLSGSGVLYESFLTGVTGSKDSGEFYRYYIPGTFVCKDLSPVTINGVFTGKNITGLNFSGFVDGFGPIYSDKNHSLYFSGSFTGDNLSFDMLSGVNYSNFIRMTNALFTGQSSNIFYEKYVFSGGAGNSFFLLDSSEVLSGQNFLLKGLSGSFSVIPDTASGTFQVNNSLTGGFNLPLDTGNFYIYSPAFLKYPESMSNTWTSGYSIESNLYNFNFDPFKFGMGNPLDFSHRWYPWNNPSYFEWDSYFSDKPYIKILFNSDVAPPPGLVCDSYCILPHPDYPSMSSWSISGSNDNNSWVLLHNVTGQKLEKGYLKIFDFANSTYYRYLNFVINSVENPIYHFPEIPPDFISEDVYLRGFAKFVPLKRTKVKNYLGSVINSIPAQTNNNNISGSFPSDGYPNEWHRAFDSQNNNFFATIRNGNLDSNNVSNRGVILNKNLNFNTGITSLGDLSQAASLRSAEFNDFYNFYGGQFSTFMGQARSNFAITNKNNSLSATSFSFTNPVLSISKNQNNVVIIASSGQTRFLSGNALSQLNADLYSSSLFGCANFTGNNWSLGSVFNQHFVNVERTASFTPLLQNTNGANYIYNNGLIYTNLSGSYITGFPLVRNTGATGPLNWESGVDSDGYSQLRYNLHNEQNGSTNRRVGVSGVILHDLFIPKLNTTKRVAYLYGDFSSSKWFRGRGNANDAATARNNPQGRNVFAQRMSTGRDTLLNYEFRNSGFGFGDAWVESMVIDTGAKNLIISTESTDSFYNSNKGRLYFYSLPTETGLFPVAQDVRNAYNGIVDPSISGIVSGGFTMKILPIFNCDSNIKTMLLSGASGLFLGGDFSNARINSSLITSPNFQKAILFNPYARNGTGQIVTGYGINNNTVWSMDLDNAGRIHLGGNFNGATSNGTVRNRYACYNALNSNLEAFDFNLNSTVYAVYVNKTNNTLWLGGDFTTLNNGAVSRNRAAKINLSAGGVIDTSWGGAGFNSRVRGIKTGFNNELLFYGNFSQFSGVNCRFIARFDSNGNFITGGAPIFLNNTQLRTDTNSDVNDCEIDPVDKSVYLIFRGNNTNYAADMQDGDSLNQNFNYSYRRAIRYNYDTLTPSGVAPSFPHGQALCAKYWNNRMIFGGGHFNHAGFGQFTKGVAAFFDAPTGNLWMDFNPQLNSFVNSACKVSDGIILAGNFTSCGGLPASGLAKVDFFGRRMTGFNPNCINPNITKIKNTPSGVFVFSTKSWNSSSPGNFYRIDPDNGSVLKNYRLNIYDSSYAEGDFFIDTSAGSIGHVVVGNIKSYNSSSFIEYTFPTAINSIQGYDIILTGVNPISFDFMASGQSDTQYRTLDTKAVTSNNYFYSNRNISYPLSGIKKIRFSFLPEETGFVSINHINIYEKQSGFLTGLSLRLDDVRGSGFLISNKIPDVLYTGNLLLSSVPNPLAKISVDAVYEQTGNIPLNQFYNYLNGSYRSTGIGLTGNFQITPESGFNEINKIKINLVTEQKPASLNFKLKSGINSILNDSSDFIIFNTGNFLSENQSSFSFQFFNSNFYQSSNNFHFSGVEDLVYKINTFHSGWLSGSYNSSSRDLTFTASPKMGEFGNLMFIQPIIKSGLRNFFDSSSDLSTSSFYFTGGKTSYLSMNTGISGFYSGTFTGSKVYIHKNEYRNIFIDTSLSTSSGFEILNAFTGFTGVSYSGVNSYSDVFYATGMVDYFYDVSLTGLASGFNPLSNQSGIVPAIIYKTGKLTTESINGFGSWTNFILTGSGSTGKVYTVPSGGNNFTQVSNYWINPFSGFFNFSAVKTGFYSNVYSIPISITTGTGWIDYESRFGWNMNVKTGSFSSNQGYSGTSLLFNSGINMYSGTGFLQETSCVPFTPSASKYVKFEINHFNPYNTGNNIMKYTISGLNSANSYLFTGLIFK